MGFKVFYIFLIYSCHYPMAQLVKNLYANSEDARDAGSIPVSGRPPGGRSGNAVQYSCLENPMDRGAWLATVHKVAKE